MPVIKTIFRENNKILIVDQTLLPKEINYIEITSREDMYDAIKKLKVRGAPAIGIAGAYGLYLGIKDVNDKEKFFEELYYTARYLKSSRPTAVNLMWAIDRLIKLAEENKKLDIKELKNKLLAEADKIREEDINSCKKIGEYGFSILKNYNTLLTHCNAGGLATAEYGTALAPIYYAQEKGKIFNVYSDETRPLLQGSRITAVELKESKIPVTIICDNMAGYVMAQKKIDAVIVGADRIAANGDTANKIGTYSLAILAKYHNIPFFVAAPKSTFDLSISSGKMIPIEERDKNEIINIFGRQTGPDDVNIYNPAFDVTDNSLITAIITDYGIIYPPFKKNIEKIFKTEN